MRSTLRDHRRANTYCSSQQRTTTDRPKDKLQEMQEDGSGTERFTVRSGTLFSNLNWSIERFHNEHLKGADAGIQERDCTHCFHFSFSLPLRPALPNYSMYTERLPEVCMLQLHAKSLDPSLLIWRRISFCLVICKVAIAGVAHLQS